MPKIPSTPPSTETKEHDPWIVVSCRRFAMEVDPAALGRPSKGRGKPPVITTEIGATFLCYEGTVGALVGHNLSEALHGYDRSSLRTVEITCSDPAVVTGTIFRGPDAGRLHEKYEAALLECLKAKGWNPDEKARASYNYDNVEASRFTKAPGDAAPSIIVIKASDLFNANTDDARYARHMVERLSSYAKSQAHIGALHDLAVRNLPEGRAIAEKCRARLQSWKAS